MPDRRNQEGPIHTPFQTSADDLHHFAELRPLPLLVEQVAMLGTGEAALRAQAQLPEVDMERRRFDTLAYL